MSSNEYFSTLTSTQHRINTYTMAKNNKSSTFPIDLLPTELLAAVFSRLPTADLHSSALVCKRWYSAASTVHSVWAQREATVDFGKVVWKETDYGLEGTVEDPRRILRRLQVKGVKRLRVAGLWKDNGSLKTILEALPNLESLSLRRCKRVNCSVIFKALNNRKMPSLTSLDVSGNSGITTFCLSMIKKSFPNLEYLDATDTSVGIEFTEYLLAEFLPSKLKHLRLSGERLFLEGLGDALPELLTVRLYNGSAPEDEAILRHLAECPSLQEIQLSSNQWLNSLSLADLCAGKSRRTLRRVDLDHCYRVEDLGVKALVDELPNLEVLRLACTNISNSVMEHIAKKAKNLRHLDVTWCGNVDGAGLRSLAKSEAVRRSLLKIDVGYCFSSSEGEEELRRMPMVGTRPKEAVKDASKRMGELAVERKR